MKYDCMFLSMSFMYEDVSKEKKFLFKYFKGKIQSSFLRYILFFGEYKNFRDHTGNMCQDRWLKELFCKYNYLLSIYEKFKKNMDLESLDKLKSGKIKLASRKILKPTI